MQHIVSCITIAAGILAVTISPALAQNERPACAASPQHGAIDIHLPVTELKLKTGQPALDELKSWGIRTIIRYYDWASESLPCKSLLREEASEILRRGMSVAVVFQHNNDDPETFIDAKRGSFDAKRSLALAESIGQPFGSAIYFGVDGVDQVVDSVVWEFTKSKGKSISDARKKELIDSGMTERAFRKHARFYSRYLDYRTRVFGKLNRQPTAKDILPFVEAYFRAVKSEFDKHSKGAADRTFTIGAYGSGLTCDHLLNAGLVKFCWLAQSSGWPQYQPFLDSQRWSLHQRLPTSCPDWVNLRDRRDLVQFDFNRINAKQVDFGQWSTQRAGTRQLPRPSTCPPLKTRG